MALEACVYGVESSSEERSEFGGEWKTAPYGCVRSMDLRDFLTRRTRGCIEKESGGTETGLETRRRENSVVIERSSTDVDTASGIAVPLVPREKERKDQWRKVL